MAFAQRILRFTFSGSRSGSFSVAGLRAVVNIQAYPERSGTIAQVKIWGLSLDQMNAYSSVIPRAVASEKFGLIIEAGDLDGQVSEVLNGNILRSFIDLSGAPESVFHVTVINTFLASNPMSAQSQPGAQNAEDLIASLCPAAGLTLDNKAGAHAVLRNQSTYGSCIEQIHRIATAAGFNWKIEGTTVCTWPRNGTVDDVVINLGPDTEPAMVGYPAWWEAGLIVTSLYNPQIKIGRLINVNSSLQNASGLWKISTVYHDLTTMLPKGPWFTTSTLTLLGDV